MISDGQALALVAAVIPDQDLVDTAKELFEERNVLLEVCTRIATWDTRHSEALTVEIAVGLAQDALDWMNE